MIQWLCDGANATAHGHLGRVLEIGTGCGYQTALLARMSPRVISIERLAPLHDMARRNLDALGVSGVRLVHGDGRGATRRMHRTTASSPRPAARRSPRPGWRSSRRAGGSSRPRPCRASRATHW
jgi:hypothetical protein